MPSPFLSTSNSKEAFVKEIERMILSGELTCGEKLPNERFLASHLGVSRTIINAGMQELEQKGLVRIYPRSGAYVNDYRKQGNLGTLQAIVEYNNGEFDMETLLDLIEYRIHNEVLCACMAARNRTEADVKRLRDIVDRAKEYVYVDRFVKLTTEYHQAVFAATQNRIYLMVYNAFSEMIEKMAYILAGGTTYIPAIQYMEQITDAIESQDEALAGQKMEEYTRLCAEILEEIYRKRERV